MSAQAGEKHSKAASEREILGIIVGTGYSGSRASVEADPVKHKRRPETKGRA